MAAPNFAGYSLRKPGAHRLALLTAVLYLGRLPHLLPYVEADAACECDLRPDRRCMGTHLGIDLLVGVTETVPEESHALRRKEAFHLIVFCD